MGEAGGLPAPFPGKPEHVKAMPTLGDGLGVAGTSVAVGVGAVVGVGEALAVEDGIGAAQPASRTQSRTAASVFIVR
jgi:F0F1-type ATP synthase membrane subunit c/vacuolar-type H+-ATPase subunit K